MEEKYSLEVQRFIEGNITLIEQDTKESWEEVFSLVKAHDNHFVNEFIEIMDSAQHKFDGLVVYKYNKGKNEFQNYDGQPIKLDKLKLFLLEHRVCVTIDYKTQKIIILGIEERNSNPICENHRLLELFEQYSETTLKKAGTGDFEDLIHFVQYHSINKICVKHEKDMRDFRMIQYRKEQGDNAVSDYQIDIFDMLGCFVDTSNEIWICDELIQNKAIPLAKEYSEKLFGDNSLPHEAIVELLYKKVFTHEFGHRVFDWVGTQDRVKKEKQANYFSSYITDGRIDGFISDFTRRQSKEYHNPYLKGDTRAEELYK